MNRIAFFFLIFFTAMTVTARCADTGTDKTAVAEEPAPEDPVGKSGINGIEGYAGPGWSVLFDITGIDGEGLTGEMASLGAFMFRITDSLFLGPITVNEESSSEPPDIFLGGIKVEGRLKRLSAKFYSTHAALSVLAGASDINETPHFTAQFNAEISANLHIMPFLTFCAGPLMSLRIEPSGLTFLPGFTFSLKESTPLYYEALIDVPEDGIRVAGSWQGLIVFVNGRPAFIDGGGTRLELPCGLAFGAAGGVLRQELREQGSNLAIMLAGGTVGWNYRPVHWFTLNPRLAGGVEMFGWYDDEGNLDGGPHFNIRPELNIYFGILPFVELGGGVGYNFVAGEAGTAVPVDSLSSPAVNMQIRVGHR